jgi:WD40 repeat protein
LPAGQGECSTSFAAHASPVNALAALPAAQGGAAGALLMTASKDHSLRLWQLPGSSPAGAAGAGEVAALALYQGHTDGVECVAVAPSGSRCCSGGWDGQLLLWRTGERRDGGRPGVVRRSMQGRASWARRKT